jgi:hypothetical protein
VLAYPIRRSQLIIAKAGTIAAVVLIIALAIWIGLILGVALAGGESRSRTSPLSPSDSPSSDCPPERSRSPRRRHRPSIARHRRRRGLRGPRLAEQQLRAARQRVVGDVVEPDGRPGVWVPEIDAVPSVSAGAVSASDRARATNHLMSGSNNARSARSLPPPRNSFCAACSRSRIAIAAARSTQVPESHRQQR